MCWPNDPWTGDIKLDAELASTPFYRHHSKRQTTKKVGHASNYNGQPQTIAEQTGMPITLVRQFQPVYFTAFPAHKLWHVDVDETLRRKGHLVSLLGRRRWFFNRRTDPATLREAIAYDPQSSLADIVNTAMLNIWRLGIAAIVMHDHDALTFMYREADEDRLIPILMQHLTVPVPLAEGRTLRIPYDCEIGWNKGKYHPEKNPNGFKAYTGHDDRKRQATPGIMDRVVCRPNKKSPRA
jgi:DNA polymerase I-like protein with 3'-5' exonuclease and polymerase domains